MVLTYNLLAFGLQVFAGFLVDRLKLKVCRITAGLIITGIAAVITPLPIAAIVRPE